jgi:hypothetical protein
MVARTILGPVARHAIGLILGVLLLELVLRIGVWVVSATGWNPPAAWVTVSLELGSFGTPLAASGVLAVLYALVYRRVLRAWLGRLATGEFDERDARAGRIALGALIVTGFVLRIARTQEYGFNLDEAQFVYFGAADSLASVWRFVMSISPHPPANIALLHFLQKVSWNPLWLRLPSVLSGTLLIWLAHRFGRALFGPAAGLAMAVLVTFSPVMIELSRVCRNYAPGFVFLLLSVHLMVRHLQTNRPQPLAAFAITAPLAGVWHYVFPVVFVALDLVVAIELLLRRRPWRAWLAVALAHLPFAATMGFLYLVHVSQIPEFIVGFHQDLYRSMLSPAIVDFIDPFREVWHYLELSAFSEIFLGLSVLGAFCLLINGERLGLLVCVVPLAVAYAFSWADKIPLGGSRHSAYIFPFLFGLVASLVPEFVDGYRRTLANLRRHLARAVPRRPALPPNAGRTSRIPSAGIITPALGTAVVAVFGAVYAGASLLHYGTEKFFNLLDPDIRKRELSTWYRLKDVERGFALLEERVGENDLVVLQPQGTYAMRMHYHLTPPDGTWNNFLLVSDSESKYVRNGITYYSCRVGMNMTPRSLVYAVKRVRSVHGLPEPERVWTVQGAWEAPLSLQFSHQLPGLAFDSDVVRASKGVVFAIDMKVLSAIDTEPEKTETEEAATGAEEEKELEDENES